VNKSLKNRSARSAAPAPGRRVGDKSRKSFNVRDFLSQSGIGKGIEEFRKGTSIFSQGDPANAIHYIQKGRVKLSVVSKAGKEAVVALLAAGDFLGESCIASGHSVRLSTAVALSDCAVLTISQEQMLRVLREQSALSSWNATHAFRPTWWTNSSIPAKSDWLAHCSCSHNLEKKATPRK